MFSPIYYSIFYLTQIKIKMNYQLRIFLIKLF